MTRAQWRFVAIAVAGVATHAEGQDPRTDFSVRWGLVGRSTSLGPTEQYDVETGSHRYTLRFPPTMLIAPEWTVRIADGLRAGVSAGIQPFARVSIEDNGDTHGHSNTALSFSGLLRHEIRSAPTRPHLMIGQGVFRHFGGSRKYPGPTASAVLGSTRKLASGTAFGFGLHPFRSTPNANIEVADFTFIGHEGRRQHVWSLTVGWR